MGIKPQVESIEQLEAVIDAKGQQIKQQLFEHQLASLVQRQKPAPEVIACPECKKSNFQRLSTSPTKDQIRSYFLCPTGAEVPSPCGRLFQLNSGYLAGLKV